MMSSHSFISDIARSISDTTDTIQILHQLKKKGAFTEEALQTAVNKINEWGFVAWSVFTITLDSDAMGVLNTLPLAVLSSLKNLPFKRDLKLA